MSVVVVRIANNKCNSVTDDITVVHAAVLSSTAERISNRSPSRKTSSIINQRRKEAA